MRITDQEEGGRKESKMLLNTQGKKIYHEVKWNSCLREKQFSFMNSYLTEGQEYEQLKLNKPILICLSNCDWSQSCCWLYIKKQFRIQFKTKFIILV